MILTQCAVCATELGLTLGKKCGRCSTRYCGPECQKQHWEEGGHDKLCKPIKKAGGAEQYNANTKYAEAVAVAAEACAEDTKGQTCYICTQALHWKTKEGLVRGCACRGTAGFAHVSCLAEQAKILCDEAEANNLDIKVLNARLERWWKCSLCEQEYHGVVRCALGWASWKTYLGRPEKDQVRILAMAQLGNGLSYAFRFDDQLRVLESNLSTLTRLGVIEECILDMRDNIASCYSSLGRQEEALKMRREVYARSGQLSSTITDDVMFLRVLNLAVSLRTTERFTEAKYFLREQLPKARRVLGEGHHTTLRMRWTYAETLFKDDDATLDDLREAVTTLEETTQTGRRVFGGTHPLTVEIEKDLRKSRAALRARETPPTSSHT